MSNILIPPISTPQRLKMSYEEYLNVASETHITEWVDGEIITYMPPIIEHQDIVTFLAALLRSFVKVFSLGKLLVAPLEIKLWPGGPSREPDLIFVSHDNPVTLARKSKRVEGTPDLVIEIVSPGSAREDRVRKFSEYEQAGVREYWLIDPRNRQHQVDIYALGQENEYQETPADAKGRFHSTVLPGFWLDSDWLWEDDLPDHQICLAHIMLSMPTLSPEKQAYYQQTLDLFD